jgi:nucleoside-triphosphatase
MGRITERFENVILLTGKREVGKTNLLVRLLQECQTQKIAAAGVISPAVFSEGHKTAIDLLNLRGGEVRRLADLRTDGSAGIMTDRWVFTESTLEWGNQVLASASPCDLLIVDELGPIELQRGLGLQNGIGAVTKGEFCAAIAVIRPELIKRALHLWPGCFILEAAGDIENTYQQLIKKITDLLRA